MADQNITALPVATSPASSDQILLVGATEEKLIDYDKLADAILTKLTSKQYTLDQGTKTLPAALNELNSKAFMDAPTTSLNVVEYIKTLDEGKLHFFRTASKTPGNPYENGTCLFMIYIINRANDGVGISINHSTTAYYLRFSRGEIIYSAL